MFPISVNGSLSLIAPNVNLHTLSNYENLLLLAEKSNYITSSEAEILSKWRIDPGNWCK